ncbi:hypothetical protein H4Q26_016170 [Puccinia striiformis f. sp. tritici PST-130]|nr:hypothetical protein H4Q26_016170 [Puccinia striiformis f. sp. tritici PST-130]
MYEKQKIGVSQGGPAGLSDMACPMPDRTYPSECVGALMTSGREGTSRVFDGDLSLHSKDGKRDSLKMAESTSQTSDGSENQQLQNQIEAVIGKFTILRNNCNPPHLHDDPGLMEAVLSNISMEETSFKERLMLALGCHYLPTLQRQLTTLLRSLDPSGLPKEAESRLKIVSECQADLEQSISAINIAIAVICPEPTSGPH